MDVWGISAGCCDGCHEITDDHAPETLGITAPPQTSQFLCLEAGLQDRTDIKV